MVSNIRTLPPRSLLGSLKGSDSAQLGAPWHLCGATLPFPKGSSCMEYWRIAASEPWHGVLSWQSTKGFTNFRHQSVSIISQLSIGCNPIFIEHEWDLKWKKAVKWWSGGAKVINRPGDHESHDLTAQEVPRAKRGASLMVQWLRVRLDIQGTVVQFLVREDLSCCRPTEPVCPTTKAHTPEPVLRNNEKPTQLNQRGTPACRN